MATQFTEAQDIIAALKARLPGAGSDAIAFELSLVAQEFFRETFTWVETSTRPLVAGQASYDVPDVQSGTPCGFIYVRAGESSYYAPTPIGAVTGNYLRFEINGSFNSITLTPTPTASGETLTVAAVMTLRDVVEGGDSPIVMLPREQTVRNKQAFIEGTLATMMGHANKPYSNPRMAAFYFRRFRFHMTRAKRTAMTGYTRANVPFAFPNPAGSKRGGPWFPTGA